MSRFTFAQSLHEKPGELDCPGCRIAAGCGLRGALGEALAAFVAVLDRYSLDDLVGWVERLRTGAPENSRLARYAEKHSGSTREIQISPSHAYLRAHLDDIWAVAPRRDTRHLKLVKEWQEEDAVRARSLDF